MSSTNETPCADDPARAEAAPPPDPAAAAAEPPRVEAEKKATASKGEALASLILGSAVLWLAIAKAAGTWKMEGGGFFAFGWAFFTSYGVLLLIAMAAMSAFFFFRELLHPAIKVWGPYAIALVLGPLALWYWIGAYSWLRDIAIAVVAAIVVAILHGPTFRWLRRKLAAGDPAAAPGATATIPQPAGWLARSCNSPSWCRCYTVLVWLLATWTLGSLANFAFGPYWTRLNRPLAADPARFADLGARAARPQTGASPSADTPPLRLGVTLSGGGFRAALMHAGVLAALEELHAPITGLATVSGGSIIGGYYVLGGTPDAFREAVAEGRFNLKRDLFDVQNFVFLPCPGHIPILEADLLFFCSHSRIEAQANLLDRVLLGAKPVSALQLAPEGKPWWTRPPFWVVGATDLLRGEAMGISPHGVFRRGHATPARGLHQDQLRREPSSAHFQDLGSWRTLGERRVAELVAVSGAFPGAFGSLDLELVSGSRFQVVDGGVTDNLGYSLLASALEVSTWRTDMVDVDGLAPRKDTGIDALGKQWQLDTIIVSDGGMPLMEEKSLPSYLELARAMDVVYASAGIAVAGNPVRKIWLSPVTIREPELRDEDLERIPAAFRERWNVRTVGALQEDYRRVKRAFLATSTLKDSFELPPHTRAIRHFSDDPRTEGRQTVEELFRLGQYLVYLNSCDIKTGLQLERRECPGPAPAPILTLSSR